MDTIIIILIVVAIGAIAGWLASVLVRGTGLGLGGNVIVGIVGAVVANWLLPQIGIFIGGGLIAEIINATIGAVVVVLLIKLFKRV